MITLSMNAMIYVATTLKTTGDEYSIDRIIPVKIKTHNIDMLYAVWIDGEYDITLLRNESLNSFFEASAIYFQHDQR